MELWEAIPIRHSVRSFTDRKIDKEVADGLQKEIAACNAEGGVHFQLVLGDEKAFGGLMAHYGKFRNVKNYAALVAPKGREEAVGYYGERLALRAQTLGLNSCWVALTYSKRKTACAIGKGEKLVCVLALGYGVTQGVAHKSKTFADVSPVKDAPEWFVKGVDAALLAPTAMNQQKFTFSLYGGEVKAAAGKGFYTKLDLGIAKFHFRLAAGEDFVWAENET